MEYKGKLATPTAKLTTVKLLVISVLSTPDAQIMTADKKYYLGSSMILYEYMRITLKCII